MMLGSRTGKPAPVHRDDDKPLRGKRLAMLTEIRCPDMMPGVPAAPDVRTISRTPRDLDGLMAAAAEHDRSSPGHEARVARITETLAGHAGLSRSDQTALVDAAHVHDVGKLIVPRAVLMKPAALTAQEWVLMRRHPGAGARLLRRAGADDLTIAVARWHHERWDGQGYPDRLAGQEIPLCARIVMIADVYDALRSPRPYRGPLSHEKTLAIMSEDMMPGAFDPDLFQAFLACADRVAQIDEAPWQLPAPDNQPASYQGMPRALGR